ncbi:MAG: phosphoribosyl-ATP diphosphatase [SAR324 cluster bacterium]|nr:phosphoribosyl-ATP diphosphatase [SAR324 cluster bacterium]
MKPRTLEEVFAVISQRLESGSGASYVASLNEKGTDAILKKIGEEASEVLIAAKNENMQDCIHEIADLWFHSMVLMAHMGLSLADIEMEFGRRFGQSGLIEKANRPTQ